MISTKRRTLAMLGAFAILVGACGGANPTTAPTGSTAPGDSAPPASAPAAGGGEDFTFVVDSEPTTLATEPDDLPTSWIVAEIYSSLYQPDYQLNYVPFLAAEPPVTSEDGLTWTVKIRPDVQFHDGTVLTADDVIFTYQLHLSENCRGNPDVCSSIADNLATVTKIDELTVEFVLKQKFAPFISSGLGAVLIVPKAAVEASFARFQEAAGAVAAADVKALLDEVVAATEAEACSSEEPPATCSYEPFTAQIEALLGSASIELTNKAQYNTGGESGTDFDPAAYAQGLFGQLRDLDTTLNASAIDQIAASIKLIDFGKAPIGTGPFKFVKYNAGQNVELARWENYFGGTTGVDPAKIPARAFAVVMRQSAAATAALANDEIQWQQKIESEAYTTVQNNPAVQIAEYPDNGYYYIGFNMREGHIYSDKALREAFSMCINHEETVDVATAGNGAPVRANTPPFSWAYNPDVKPYVLDVEGAKAKIEASGWALGDDGVYAKDGKKLSSILYVRVGRPQRLSFAQLARDQLKLCGIEVEVQEADLNTVLIPKVLDYPNDFDTYLGGWSTALDPDDYSIFHSSEIPTAEKVSANNFPGWENPEADRLLEEARQELDQEKRKALYFEFQNLIHDELPYYFLWADLAHTGLSARVVSQNEALDLKSVGINYYNIDAWTVLAR